MLRTLKTQDIHRATIDCITLAWEIQEDLLDIRLALIFDEPLSSFLQPIDRVIHPDFC